MFFKYFLKYLFFLLNSWKQIGLKSTTLQTVTAKYEREQITVFINHVPKYNAKRFRRFSRYQCLVGQYFPSIQRISLRRTDLALIAVYLADRSSLDGFSPLIGAHCRLMPVICSKPNMSQFQIILFDYKTDYYFQDLFSGA